MQTILSWITIFLFGILVIWVTIVVTVGWFRRDKRPSKAKKSTQSTPAVTPPPTPEKTIVIKKSSSEYGGLVKGVLWLAAILTVLIAVPFLLERGVAFVNKAVPAPGPSLEQRQAAAARVSPPAPTLSSDWETISVTNTAWSRWLEVPLGYKIQFCDSEPPCRPNLRYEDVNFFMECRDDNGRALARETGQCGGFSANRIRSREDEQITVWHRLVRR